MVTLLSRKQKNYVWKTFSLKAIFLEALDHVSLQQYKLIVWPWSNGKPSAEAGHQISHKVCPWPEDIYNRISGQMFNDHVYLHVYRTVKEPTSSRGEEGGMNFIDMSCLK